MAKIIGALIVVVAVKCSSSLADTHRITGLVAVANCGIITGRAFDCLHAIHTAGVDGITFFIQFRNVVATDSDWTRARCGTGC